MNRTLVLSFLMMVLFQAFGQGDVSFIASPDNDIAVLYRDGSKVELVFCGPTEPVSRQCTYQPRKSLELGSYNESYYRSRFPSEFVAFSPSEAYAELSIGFPSQCALHEKRFFEEEKRRLENAYLNPLEENQSVGRRLVGIAGLLSRTLCAEWMHRYLGNAKVVPMEFIKAKQSAHCEELKKDKEKKGGWGCEFCVAELSMRTALVPFEQ